MIFNAQINSTDDPYCKKNGQDSMIFVFAKYVVQVVTTTIGKKLQLCI